MPQPLVHCVLIYRGPVKDPGKPRVLHLDIKGASHPESTRRQPVNLLVLDARRMRPACQKAAFEEVIRLKRAGGFRHGLLISDTPSLPLVVAAMRAGLRDVIRESLDARQLARLLADNITGGHATSRHFSALAATIHALVAPARAPSERSLARREDELLKRSEEIQNQETRLSIERAALEEREQQLRTNTRRFERTFAAMQKDIDVLPVQQSAPPFQPELDGLAAKLAQRAKALDIRERMLQELENILLGRLNNQPDHPLEVDTRPPFQMSIARKTRAA